MNRLPNKPNPTHSKIFVIRDENFNYLAPDGTRTVWIELAKRFWTYKEADKECVNGDRVTEFILSLQGLQIIREIKMTETFEWGDVDTQHDRLASAYMALGQLCVILDDGKCWWSFQANGQDEIDSEPSSETFETVRQMAEKYYLDYKNDRDCNDDDNDNDE